MRDRLLIARGLSDLLKHVTQDTDSDIFTFEKKLKAFWDEIKKESDLIRKEREDG